MTNQSFLNSLYSKKFEDMSSEEQFAALVANPCGIRPLLPRKAYKPSDKKQPIRDWLYNHGWTQKFYNIRWKLKTKVPPFSWIANYQNKKWNTVRSRYLSGERSKELHILLYFTIFEILSRFVETLYPKLDAEDLKESDFYEPFKEMQEIYDWWRLKGQFAFTGGIDKRSMFKLHAFVPHGTRPLFEKEDKSIWTNPNTKYLFPHYTSSMAERIYKESRDAKDRFCFETIKEMSVYLKRIIELSPYMEDD